MSKEQSDAEMVEIEGTKITLAELAGLDMTTVGEKRFFNTPVGMYLFEVVPDDEGPPSLRVVGGKAAMKMPCKIIDVLGLKDPNFTGKSEELIGKVHTETQFITSNVSPEYINAFLTDIGLKGKGPLKKMLADCVGLRFTAWISHRKDPNDSDKVYVALRRDKIVPVVLQAA